MESSSFFAATHRDLATRLRSAKLDHQAFEQRLQPCDLAKCKATCCHDGVRLSREDALLVQGLVEQHEPQFSQMGVDTSLPVVELASDGRGWKTCSRPAERPLLAEDFPSHFPQTRCVFLDENHYCGLQKFSMAASMPDWFHKPLTCWIHPLLLREEAGGLVVTIVNASNDPQKKPSYPGYGSCTHCGREDKKGQPARMVLEAELRALGEMAGRDFYQELNAPPVDWYDEEAQ